MELAGVVEIHCCAGKRSGEGICSTGRDMTKVAPYRLITEFEAELSGQGAACVFKLMRVVLGID